MNPQHTVPTLDDGAGVYLWDSAAICTYLIAKYGTAGIACPLYPNDDYVLRARIDQRLHFNTGVLNPLLRAACAQVLRRRQPHLDAELLADAAVAFDFLEQFLADGAFLVGQRLTLADLVCATMVANLVEARVVQLEDGGEDGRYTKVATWMRRVAAELPYFDELNQKKAAQYGQFFRAQLEQNQIKQADDSK